MPPLPRYILPLVSEAIRCRRELRSRCIDLMVLQMGMSREAAARYVDVKLKYVDADTLYRRLMS